MGICTLKATITDNGIALEAENDADNFVLKQFDYPNWIGIANIGVKVSDTYKKRHMLIVPIVRDKKRND